MSPAAPPAGKVKKPSPGAFPLRGIKGWAWTPGQYLQEIPFLAECGMNFLMNCYLSLYSDPVRLVNRWWQPLAPARRRAYGRVIRACRRHDLEFCFALHPQLNSPRPYAFTDEDYRALWPAYDWAQGQGVRWFSLCLDDVQFMKAGVEMGGALQARTANRLFEDLRRRDPGANLIFCPTWYWGDGHTPKSEAYLAVLARELHPEIYAFWTGPEVFSHAIARETADSYRAAIGHRLILWDNYPVNDGTAAVHLGPLVGRDPALPSAVEGYMGNPMRRESGLNRLPLWTMAEFARDPQGYDAGTALARAIGRLGGSPAQRAALAALCRLYPGTLARRRAGVPDFETAHTVTVLEDIKGLLARGDRAGAVLFLKEVQASVAAFKRAFPAGYEAEKRTFRRHLALMRRALKEAGGGERRERA